MFNFCTDSCLELITPFFYSDLDCISYLKEIALGFSNLEAQKRLKEIGLVPDSLCERAVGVKLWAAEAGI